MRTISMTMAVLLLAMAAGQATAFSFRFTPWRLAHQTGTIIGVEVIDLDIDAGTMTLKVTDIFKGKFDPGKIKVTTTDRTRDEPIFIEEGLSIAAFIGSDRSADRVLFYTGEWQEAAIVDGDRSQWRWTTILDERNSPSLHEAFSGDPARLVEMMADLKRGAYYFPSQLNDFFKYSQIVLGTFDKPLGGVALYDVDDDGDVDVYGCSAAGNRLYLQGEALEFADATDTLGLGGIASASCSFADADADGRADLLADGVIYTQGEDGRFSRTTWLPATANEAVKSAAFVELNGDGYPDVVVSQINRGLHAFLNPGPGGDRAFRDATEPMGLSQEASGAEGTGFFAPGVWDGDGRCALFYAADGNELLLRQTEDQAFAAVTLDAKAKVAPPGSDPGDAVVGAFAPVWRNDAISLLVTRESSFALLASRDSRVRNMIWATDELEDEPAKDRASVLCEDLDADGYVDVLTAAREDHCQYYCNRGYGVFTCAESYDRTGFPRAFRNGAHGLAAGDVNDDGANDILLGGTDGTLALMVNHTLSLREPPTEKTFHLYRKRYNVTILAIDVAGPIGVRGARLLLTDAEDRPVAQRLIGNNVNVGSCSSDRVNLAVREDGQYVLTVTWSDGASREFPVEVGKQRRIPMTVERPE